MEQATRTASAIVRDLGRAPSRRNAALDAARPMTFLDDDSHYMVSPAAGGDGREATLPHPWLQYGLHAVMFLLLATGAFLAGRLSIRPELLRAQADVEQARQWWGQSAALQDAYTRQPLVQEARTDERGPGATLAVNDDWRTGISAPQP